MILCASIDMGYSRVSDLHLYQKGGSRWAQWLSSTSSWLVDIIVIVNTLDYIYTPKTLEVLGHHLPHLEPPFLKD
jgi:hypothetical protein